MRNYLLTILARQVIYIGIGYKKVTQHITFIRMHYNATLVVKVTRRKSYECVHQYVYHDDYRNAKFMDSLVVGVQDVLGK